VPLDAPAALEQIVKRCLAPRRTERFQTIAEVRAALEQISVKPVDQQPSVAVLPFVNRSADKENEYFSDGLAEEILNLLAKIPGLKVIARTSSFAFRGKEQDIIKIAEALRVRTVLEGSVRRAGSRIRITAQLIEAENGSQLWSERYDREMTDIFAIQDEIGQAISEALKVRLAFRTPRVKIEAYQNYLKGQYHYLRLTPESLARANEFFERSLAIDPNYAPAYSGLAESYFYLAGLGINPVGEMAPMAKAAAEKALAIDPANDVAHSVLGAMAAVFDFDWKVAENHFGKAMRVDVVPTMVRLRYAMHYLVPSGRVPDATEQIRLALETDPLSMPLHLCMVLCMYFAKQYRQAIEYARRALEIDANYYLIWNAMGLAQLGAGLVQEAIPSLKRVVELAPWFSDGGWYLATAYYQAGDHQSSNEWAHKLISSHGHTYGPAIYYAVTGEGNAMFEALEQAHGHRDVDLPLIQTQPLFDPWRADPRFQTLLQRMHLA
jgi:TolB-like protein/Tfp pilus assembly protein PilF